MMSFFAASSNDSEQLESAAGLGPQQRKRFLELQAN